MSRWNDTYKSKTKDCPDCEYYKVEGGKENCCWGVARKILVPPTFTAMRKCAIRDKVSPWKEQEENRIFTVRRRRR